MELTGEVLMDAPRAQVWAALNDAAVLQACIPGCEEVIDDSPTERRVRVLLKMGPVRARFNGRVTLSEQTPPERCVLGFEGSGGAAGMASGSSRVELFVHGEQAQATRLTYAVKASVGGKLGQIGGRMIDASSKQLADQFFNALRERLQGGDASTATPPTAPSQTHVAAPNAPAANHKHLRWLALGIAIGAAGMWLGLRLV